MVKEVYDIIIAGAGPAGLSIAKELTKNFRVLLIDKRKIPYTTCAWYTYSDRVKEYHLEKSVLHKCSAIYYEAGTVKHYMKDDCVVLDSNKVLKYWYEEALKNGLKTLITTLKSISHDENGVIVHTDASGICTDISAKLLIDCSGFNSPILHKYNLINHINSWVIYGRTIHKTAIKNDKYIQFLPVNDGKNTYVGLYPYSKTKADLYVFYNLENSSGNIEDAKPIFDKAIKIYYPKAKFTSRELSGRIISGELNSHALDNIIFFGESGMLTPPGIGMGFNEVLQQHKKFCREITSVINRKQLTSESLNNIYSIIRDDAIWQFQQVMAKFTFYFINSPDKWEGGVKWLNALGDLSKYWMRNEMDIKWIEEASITLYKTIPLSVVVRMMPVESYLYVIEHFAKFVGESVHEESEKIVADYKKGLLKPLITDAKPL